MWVQEWESVGSPFIVINLFFILNMLFGTSHLHVLSFFAWGSQHLVGCYISMQSKHAPFYYLPKASLKNKTVFDLA